MNEKYRNLSKNTLLFAVSNFGTKILTFLLVPLYTYVLTTSEYGLVDIVTTTANLFIPLLTVNVQDAVLRFALDKKYKPSDIISIGVKINAYGCGAIFLALVCLRALKLVNLELPYVIFFFCYYSLGAITNSLNHYLKARDKVKVLMVSGIVVTLITCGLNVVLLLVVKMGVNGYMIANASGLAVGALIQLFYGGIYKDIHFIKDKALQREMLMYSAPLIANSLAWWVNNASDRYIVTFFCGVAVNGIYSVAYKIPTILSTIQSVFYNAWSISAIVDYDKEDKDGFIGNTYTLYSAACILASSFLILINIPLSSILYSKDFFLAWKYVPLLLAATFFNGASLFIGCLFTAVRDSKTISKTTVMGAVVNTILNFVLVWTMGAIGAAIATLAGYVTSWGLRLYWSRQIITMKVDWKRHFLSCILLVFQAVLATFNVGIGYELAVVAVIILLHLELYKKLIRKLISMIKK